MIYFIICVVIFVLMALLIVGLIFLIISLIEWGNVKDGATKIPFKTFVKFYNIAPDRWVLNNLPPHSRDFSHELGGKW